jgi:hypothetical protein
MIDSFFFVLFVPSWVLISPHTSAAASNCEHCRVRQKMQQKYLAEAFELYEEDALRASGGLKT